MATIYDIDHYLLIRRMESCCRSVLRDRQIHRPIRATVDPLRELTSERSRRICMTCLNVTGPRYSLADPGKAKKDDGTHPAAKKKTTDDLMNGSCFCRLP